MVFSKMYNEDNEHLKCKSKPEVFQNFKLESV
jgi:hypothetical protein